MEYCSRVKMAIVELSDEVSCCQAQLLAILPLAMVHTLGNLFTNVSLGKVAVSFTHTIKAMEPFFSVLLSALFLGEVVSKPGQLVPFFFRFRLFRGRRQSFARDLY
jgi:hypothetical protein